MPGVEITTSVRTGPQNPLGPSNSRFIIAGICSQGPTDRCGVVHSITEYIALFGDRDNVGAVMFDAAQCYFEEGGGEAVIARAVGAGATKATLTVKNRASSPLDTLRFDAISPGQWGATVSIQIDDGDNEDVTVTVVRGGVAVEKFTELTSPADVSAALASSAWVRATTLGAATTDPLDALPAVTAVTPLVGGDDNRAAVTATTVVAALNSLVPKDVGPGAVATPGYPSDTVAAGLVAHAKANRRIALLATARTADQTAAISAANGVLADGDYAGIFWPWVVAPEGNGTKTISPEAYVAGVRARAQAETGIWQAPAGARAAARFITATTVPVDQTLNNTLGASKVNGITTTRGQVRLFNWLSLSSNQDQWQLLSSRDFINGISAILETALDTYVFATIDGKGQLEGEIEGAIKGVLQPIADAGGLYALNPPVTDATAPDPTSGDDGYSVTVSAGTSSQQGGNTIVADVGVRLSPFAALIKVQIRKSNLTASV